MEAHGSSRMTDHRMFPKRAIFRMLLMLSWERGGLVWEGRLSMLLARGSGAALAAGPMP